MDNKLLVSEQRNYKVLSVDEAKNIVINYFTKSYHDFENINFGLPEINDRYHVWNVPILLYENFNLGVITINAKTGQINTELSSDLFILSQRAKNIKKYCIKTKYEAIFHANSYLEKLNISDKVFVKESKVQLLKNKLSDDEWFIHLFNEHDFHIGEVIISAKNGSIDTEHSTNRDTLLSRVDMNNCKKGKKVYYTSPLENLIIKGNSAKALYHLPAESIDLIFTSPPYYNAKKQYAEYSTYEEYLELMRKVIKASKRVLMSGKFFVINTSHVLISRTSRNESSTRIAVPFDLHSIFIQEGFEFIDDIIWQKPEGAGWASGRGRRFSADRNAMQYKAVPVTEYVMVYRKKSDKLIDFFIRNHPDPSLVEQSKIVGDYDRTNIWYISPARDKRHPAIFPKELAEKVISYYSFKNDIVLDPFAGIGTTALAAIKLGRKFCMVELEDKYIKSMINDIDKSSSPLLSENAFTYRDLSQANIASDSKYPTPPSTENKILKLDLAKKMFKQRIDLELISDILDMNILFLKQHLEIEKQAPTCFSILYKFLNIKFLYCFFNIIM